MMATTPCRLCLLLIVAVLLTMGAAHGQGDRLPAIAISDLTHQKLRAPVEFLVDTDATASRDGIARRPFAPLDAADVSQGVTTSAYWIRLRLDNSQSGEPREWVLHHETAYLDTMTVYHADNGGEWHETVLSDRQPFSSRPVAYRKLAFSHQTPAGGHTDLYIRLRNERADSLTLNLHLATPAYFQENARTENLLHGAYFGVMLTLMAIALITALLLKQPVYGHYAVFLGSSALMWAMLNGYGFQYLWPNAVYWHNEGTHILFLMVSMTAVQFSRQFLGTRQLSYRLDNLLGVAQGVMFAGMVLRLLDVYTPVLVLSYTMFALLIFLPLLGVMAYRRGVAYARWYVAAWLFYAGGILVGVTSAATSLLPWGMSTLAYVQTTGLIEAALLMVALGERLAGWDRDRRSALRMANHDALTGLGNRRLLGSAFETARERHAETGMPVFLLLIDLDHFKEINDTYGHDAGDKVLREFGRNLARFSRSEEDVCIRYGGEEFAVLFSAPSLDDALALTERIRRHFERTPTHHKGRRIDHTLSAGLAPLLPGHIDLTEEDLIATADSALYQAKRAGRNQTVAVDNHDVADTIRPPGEMSG